MVAPGKHPGRTGTASDPAVIAAAGLLHRRRGWIWMLVVSVAGCIVAVAVTVNAVTRGTAYVLLSLVELLMLLVFLISLTMVIVDTVRLRQHAPGVRGPARAVHRSARHPVLLPRLVDSVAYVAGAGGHATFTPASYVEQCAPRTGCTTVTNGVLQVDGHRSSAIWPAQVPLNLPFTVREPVWRWGLGSGLINGIGGAIGTFVVCLVFDAVAVLAVYIAAGPWLGGMRRRRLI
jgi:hypothetical protein